MSGLKFYSLGDFGGHGSMKHYMEHYGFRLAQRIQDADIIVFNGGEDIATSIYGEKPLSQYRREEPSQRDEREIKVFEEYAGEKFLLGICRGAQLFAALNGDTLWQDVTNHNRDHTFVDLASGKTYNTTSVHHQMVRFQSDNHELIGVSHESSMKHAPDGRHLCEKDEVDPEIFYYPKSRGLCIQGHPEYVPGSVFGDYCNDLIMKYVGENVAQAV